MASVKFYQILSFTQGFLYIAAGINHFLMPGYYVDICPEWIPFPEKTHLAAALFEILSGILLFTKKGRSIGYICIVLMLLLFSSIHIQFVIQHGCIKPEVCIPVMAAWARMGIQIILLLGAGVGLKKSI